jgi:protein-tyrosine phosphatase
MGDGGRGIVIADRSLQLQSASNFRDIGGYRTLDGRWVRMGLAYRSNGLASLSAADVVRLQGLNLRLVCDLRLEQERVRLPDRFIPGARTVTADVAADSAHRLTTVARVLAGANDAAVMDFMKAAYSDFVHLPSARRGYAEVLRHLADPSNLPAVFHCTAGKDRTGWAQAVLLGLLRVPRELITEDFVLTDRFMSAGAIDQVRRTFHIEDLASARALIAADPTLLASAFDEVERRYGSFEHYVRDGLSLEPGTISALRANFWAD